MKIRPVGAELLYRADGRAGGRRAYRHDEANSRFSQTSDRA
jgi:hypothetical protein